MLFLLYRAHNDDPCVEYNGYKSTKTDDFIMEHPFVPIVSQNIPRIV